MTQHELDIDSIVFAAMRNTFNREINDTLRDMKAKHLSEGSVSVKIKIGLIETVDENGEYHSSAIFEPKVTSKIGRSCEQKVGATGGRIQIGDDGEILIGSEQVTMDEVMEKASKGA